MASDIEDVVRFGVAEIMTKKSKTTVSKARSPKNYECVVDGVPCVREGDPLRCPKIRLERYRVVLAKERECYSDDPKAARR